MKYKLIKPMISTYSALEQVLINRGVSNLNHYLKTTDEDINSFLKFGEDTLREAAATLIRCVQLDIQAEIIVDSDCDGFTSAALLIN